MSKKPWKPKSKGAERVEKALHLLGRFTIVAEKHIGDLLKVDYFIPELGWCLEIQGVQHDQYTAHFHGDMDGFRAAQARDSKKREMCIGEGHTFIAIPYHAIMKTKTAQELLEYIVARAEEEKQVAQRCSSERNQETTEDW